MGTRVYSKAFTGVLQPHADGGSVDEKPVINDTRTITGVDLNHAEASSMVETFRARSRPMTTGLSFIPFGDQFKAAINALNIRVDWRFSVCYDHSGRRPEELSYQKGDEFQQIRKVDQEWYYGEKTFPLEGEPMGSGLLERSKMIPDFWLKMPLRVRTNRGSGRETEKSNYIYYDEYDVLEIQVSAQIHA